MKQYLSQIKTASSSLLVCLLLGNSAVYANESLNEEANVTPKAKPSAPFATITPQIVGGNPATQGDRTYQAYLGGCGGTVIADNWILTAAHCVGNGYPSSVRVGVHNRNSNEGETISVSQIIAHPSYSGNSYDVALLKLASPVNSSYVRAKLPTPAVLQAVAQPGDMLTVSGWGALSEGGSGPDVLHEVDVPVVSTSVCNSSAAYGGQIDATMICAGYQQGGKDSCQGDSGGPIVAAYQGEIYSIGTVSWGQGCARPNKYGVYARTSHVIDWINGYIGGGTPPGDSVLENGVPVTGLSAGTGQDVTYTMEVPSGATNIKFEIAGGSGDADLYVKFGSAPTDSSYDCRPYINGNAETCSGSQTGGTYYVRVKGYRAFSNVTLTGSYSDDSTPPGNDPVDRTETVNVSQGQWSRFTQVLAAGYTSLEVSISGGSGDADLYVRRGAASTLSSYDCRPYRNGNVENCDFNNPAAATWHIDVRGYSSASNVTLRIKAN